MSKIAKMYGLSGVAVLKWIKKEARLIEEVQPHAGNNIIMIDGVSL